MKNLIESYFFVKETQFYLQSGLSLRMAVSEVSENLKSDFSILVDQFVFSLDHGIEYLKPKNQHNLTSTLLDCVEMGLSGYPIFEYLEQIEEKISIEIDNTITSNLNLLPIKSLMPVVFLMFPSYLLLLFGPIILFLGDSL